MQMLATLLEIDTDLVDWIVQASPSTPEEPAKVKALFVRHTEIDRQINNLVAHRIQLAFAAIKEDVQKLGEASSELKGVAKTIANVEHVLTIAGTVASVCAKVISTLAGA